MKMRSELRRQRREKDRRLVKVWKEMKKVWKETSHEEEDDPWMEELVQTDEERAALQELEKWYLGIDTNHFTSRKGPSQVGPDNSPRQSNHKEGEKPRPPMGRNPG
jgi:hypothetical protein